jgi:predicted metal-binding protein
VVATRAVQTEQTMSTRETINSFIRLARELGALEAKLIEAASIVIAPWVRLKCRYGCDGYNTSHCCPPHTPAYQETREVIASYRHAILIHCKKLGSPTPIVSALERYIFLNGFYKAIGLGSGPCQLCAKCHTRQCIHTEQARPSMESCSIDVYATVRGNGYPIEVLKEDSDDANYYGLVLIE